jgi:predicted Zn-dependent protease
MSYRFHPCSGPTPVASRGMGLLLAILLASCATPSQSGPGPLISQANADLRAGKYRESRKILNDLSRSDKNDPAVWNNLATLEFRERHLHKAMADLDRGLSIDPDNPELRLNKVRLLLAMGKNPEARTLLLQIGEKTPWPPGFRILMAIADWRTGHKSSARLLFREILAVHPNDPLAEAYLAKPTSGMHTTNPPESSVVPKP